jgi:hypothetical protein
MVAKRMRSRRLGYLSIFELEDELGLATFDRLAHELRGDPAFGSIRLPRSCADIIRRRHQGAARQGAGGELTGSRREMATKGIGPIGERHS